jgi:4-amino-4-deoxychorismate lyase
LEKYIFPPNNKFLKCNVIYDKNGIIDITYNIYKKKTISSFKLVYDNNIVYDKKYCNRLNIIDLYKQKDDCDEIIIIKNNLITDTSIANIALFVNNEWITPKLPLFNGITKSKLVKKKILKEKHINLAILLKSTQIATLNVMVDFNIINKFKIKE